MPELPEVETVVRDLRQGGLPGRQIQGGRIAWPRTIAALTPRAFLSRVRGRRIETVDRRAKYIVMRLDDGAHIVVHLRMTGRLQLVPDSHQGPYVRARLRLDDGRDLAFSDTRKFGRWEHVLDLGERFAALGPEPLARALTGARFHARLQRHRRLLKPLLLDQGFIAGLGNIYVDECLWDARLSPLRLSHTITRDQAGDLLRSIRRVLRRGIVGLGTTLGSGETNFYSVGGRRGRNQDQLRVFRRQGEPCPRCGTMLVRSVVGQRGTHTCPACQV